MAYTGALFYVGKDPTFALGASVPFMMNPRQQHAWFYHGGGNDLFNDFLGEVQRGRFPVRQHRACNGAAGSARRSRAPPICRASRCALPGSRARVAVGVGIVPQQIAPGDIYPALERGAIDAVEYIGPYDDEKLGFHKITKFYYTPGWQEGGTIFHAMINKGKWTELPPSLQARD